MITYSLKELIVPLHAAVTADTERKAVVWVDVLEKQLRESWTVQGARAGDEACHL